MNKDDVESIRPDAILDALAWRASWLAGVQAGLDDADGGLFASDDELAAVIEQAWPDLSKHALRASARANGRAASEDRRLAALPKRA